MNTPAHRDTTRIATAWLALLLCLGAARTAGAIDLDRLELSLSDHERLPSRQALLLHGSEAEVAAALRQIALQGRRALARNRALSVLAHFPSPQTAKVLDQVIVRHQKARGGLELLQLRQALVAYAAVVGPGALDRVTRWFSHPNIDLRCGVATAVRLTRSPRAAEVLTARLEVEPSATVKAELRAALEQLARDRRTPPR